MYKWDLLQAIHNFSELKSLANNAKIRSSLKFLLIGIKYGLMNNVFKDLCKIWKMYKGELFPLCE